MADIWLCQSNDGNINDAAKWKTDAGAKTLTWASLATGDTLCMNGKTGVALNVDIDAGAGTSVEITTVATGGGVAGGNLVATTDRTVRGNITPGSTVPITTATSGQTLTFIGNVMGSLTNFPIHGISLTGGHSLAMTGNATGGGRNTHGVYCDCTSAQGGSTVITGIISGGGPSGFVNSHNCGVFNANTRDVTIGAGSTVTGGTKQTCVGFWNNSTGNATITAAIVGSANSQEGDAQAVFNNSTGTITITGDVDGGSGAGAPGGIWNKGTGTITITGDLSSGSAVRTAAVYNESTGVVTVTGNIINGITGGAAVLGNIRWTPGIGHSEQYGYDATHYYYYAKTIPKADVKLGVDGNGAGAPETGTLVAGSGGGRLVGASVLISEG